MKIPKSIYILIWSIFAIFVFLYDFTIFCFDENREHAYPTERILIMFVFAGYIYLYLKSGKEENGG
jgi:uncharacterized membrane protein